MKINKHFVFWILSFAAIIGLILPSLIQDGMFMDGILYTSVSKNMAHNIGTFWFPKFSALGTYNPTFHEHPPLVFAIQSLFFRLFGDSIYVERFYSFFTACVNACLISALWKLITRDYEKINKMGWLPILLWIIIPVNFWAFRNNIMENTMGIFTIASIYFSYDALYNNKLTYMKLVLAGIFIFLASFSKGVPGLFPLIFIGLYWIITRNISFSKMLLYSSILLFVPIIIYLLLIVNNSAYESLLIYVSNRLMSRIDSDPLVDNRFYTLIKLTSQLLPVIIIVLLLLLVFKIKSVKNHLDNINKKKSILFILVGLSGSLPLMLTMVQREFYFAHSLAFFAIGFSLLIAPGLSILIENIRDGSKSFNVLKIISISALIATIVISILQIGKTRRDKDLLSDVYKIGHIVPSHSTIAIAHSMWNEHWDMQCYLIRHFNISVDPDNMHKYFLVNKNMLESIPSDYIKIADDFNGFDLYKKKD